MVNSIKLLVLVSAKKKKNLKEISGPLAVEKLSPEITSS